MASIGNYWKIPWHLVLIFVFLSTGTLVLGYLYYEKQTVHLQREMEGKIKAIANLKVKEIVAWRQERLHDALTIFDDPIFAREVLEWLEGRAAPHRKAEITHRMQGLKQNLYEKITLLDPQGTVRLAIPKTDPEISPLIKETALDSLRRHRVIFTDLHLDPKKEIKLDLIVPIHFHESGKTINIGTILLKIDPYLSLYPFILSWPTLSDTAEFALVRREENEIVYLNELRHHKDTALLLRLPLTDEDDPGVKATLGKEEVTEGIDYRGVPVLAATRAIPDSPWFLVAKIDISEINAPLKEQFWLMAFLLIALIVSSGIGIAYFWRNREVLFYRQQYEVERERRDLAQKYEYLIKHANDIILTMDQDFKIIEANDLAISSYGYPREELFRLQLEDLYAQEHRRLGETPVAEMEAQNGRTYETVHRRRDGTTFPVAISSSEMEINGDKLYQSIIRDITKSKKREKALLESEEQLRFLSSQLLMVQENERRRISKELHDELGSSLMALKFHLSSIEARLAKGEKGLRSDLQSLLHYLDGVIEEVRRLSWDLSPGVLEELGFAAAINSLIEDFSKHYDIRWSRTEIDELNGSFSPLAQVNIYRIFQESLANIGRHAQASQITVNVQKQDGSVAFTVEDNGRGFDMSEVYSRQGKQKGIGLAAMEERAQFSGGSLEIWSKPGAGTKIIFTIHRTSGIEPLDKDD